MLETDGTLSIGRPESGRADIGSKEAGLGWAFDARYDVKEREHDSKTSELAISVSGFGSRFRHLEYEITGPGTELEKIGLVVKDIPVARYGPWRIALTGTLTPLSEGPFRLIADVALKASVGVTYGGTRYDVAGFAIGYDFDHAQPFVSGQLLPGGAKRRFDGRDVSAAKETLREWYLRPRQNIRRPSYATFRDFD